MSKFRYKPKRRSLGKGQRSNPHTRKPNSVMQTYTRDELKHHNPFIGPYADHLNDLLVGLADYADVFPATTKQRVEKWPIEFGDKIDGYLPLSVYSRFKVQRVEAHASAENLSELRRRIARGCKYRKRAKI